MKEILEDYEIHIFCETEDGSLNDMQTHYPSDFGYVLPAIGDEIPSPMRWSGDVTQYKSNGFLVVKRRIFLYHDGKIVLICKYKQATIYDRDIY